VRILLDECAPSALKSYFRKHGYECRTVQEAGWSGKRNAELLNLAETNFDVLFTVDTNLRYQQNLTNRRIAIVILQSSSNRLENLRPFFPECVESIGKTAPGEIVLVGNYGA
jgi:predicted nuclease of predicted toxin-antitoxin system